MTIDMMSDSFHNDTTGGIEGFANASVGKLELFFDEQEASLNRNIDLNASLREFGAVTSPDLPGCLAIRKLAGCGRQDAPAADADGRWLQRCAALPEAQLKGSISNNSLIFQPNLMSKLYRARSLLYRR